MLLPHYKHVERMTLVQCVKTHTVYEKSPYLKYVTKALHVYRRENRYNACELRVGNDQKLILKCVSNALQVFSSRRKHSYSICENKGEK